MIQVTVHSIILLYFVGSSVLILNINLYCIERQLENNKLIQISLISDFERALTIRVFCNSFFNNNIRILMMLIVPRFDLTNIFTHKTDSFELCKEGQCAEAIGYQVAFFLLLRPIIGLAKYVRHTITIIFCKKRAVKDELNRVDGSLIEFVEKQHGLFSGQRFGKQLTLNNFYSKDSFLLFA